MTATTAPFDVKHRSRALTDGPERAAARAYLHGIGYSAEDLAKPIVGVAHSWIETMPCNFNNRVLAAKVKEGIRAAGGTPMELNTIAISDGITMGTPGMRASLVSRELIADSIELVASAHCFDALVTISGCDKTIPGTVMALARLDIPGLMLYGGSIRPGHWHGQDVTIQQVFEAVGAYAAGKISEQELHELEEAASPGAGACAGQFTANTMAMAFEVLGISPAGSAMVPAEDGRKPEVARQVGELAIDVLRRGLRPSEVITKPALENAIAAVATSGGSTNGVLHLLAVAHEMGVALDIEEFDAISARTPLLCDLQPGGHYVATDLYDAGGVPLVLKRLQEAGILNGEALTVTGRTIGRSQNRSSRRAVLRSCAVMSRPRAVWSSSPATSGANTPAPRACSTARPPRWLRCSPKRSRPATSS
jgi:dihydroxy-acid dehydratase